MAPGSARRRVIAAVSKDAVLHFWVAVGSVRDRSLRAVTDARRSADRVASRPSPVRSGSSRGSGHGVEPTDRPRLVRSRSLAGSRARPRARASRLDRRANATVALPPPELVPLGHGCRRSRAPCGGKPLDGRRRADRLAARRRRRSDVAIVLAVPGLSAARATRGGPLGVVLEHTSGSGRASEAAIYTVVGKDLPTLATLFASART